MISDFNRNAGLFLASRIEQPWRLKISVVPWHNFFVPWDELRHLPMPVIIIIVVLYLSFRFHLIP